MKYMSDPFMVIIDDASKLTLHGLKQYYIETKERNKLSNLMSILGIKNISNNNNISSNISNNNILNNIPVINFQQVIIFCKAPQNAKYIEYCLDNARAIIPETPLEQRAEILTDFKNREFNILATTDILSRGIDIQNVNLVINYDLPADPQTYLHRVGRAGRFETSGTAVSFVNGTKDTVRLNEIMDLYEIDISEYKS